jgi:hypothetical protein
MNPLLVTNIIVSFDASIERKKLFNADIFFNRRVGIHTTKFIDPLKHLKSLNMNSVQITELFQNFSCTSTILRSGKTTSMRSCDDFIVTVNAACVVVILLTTIGEAADKMTRIL